jgi:L-lactate dehydrogenase
MKIGIVGVGMVGATTAYALIMRGVGREIVLVDLDEARVNAEADDLLHAVPFAHPMEVRVGGYEDLTGCQLVIITAGVGQRPGESRLDLLGRNAAVFAAIIPQVVANAPNAVLLIATNPVDIMTHVATILAERTGVAGQRVIGSGTTLDTARLRALLGRKLGVDSRHIHAYVLGEHGDSEVLPWSLVTVAGIPLEDYCRLQERAFEAATRKTISNQVRQAAYRIIEGKGATYYGIGSAMARIAQAVLGDQRSILTVCSRVPAVSGVKDVTISLPHLVGANGAQMTLFPPLTPEEDEALKASARFIRGTIDELDF